MPPNESFGPQTRAPTPGCAKTPFTGFLQDSCRSNLYSVNDLASLLSAGAAFLCGANLIRGVELLQDIRLALPIPECSTAQRSVRYCVPSKCTEGLYVC